jgi:hypothetical protein
VKLTVITTTAILMLMPPHIIGNSLISTPLAFAQNYTSTCSLGTNGTCFATGHADGLNNPNSQCLPDNNMDNSQTADYCSGFYSAHNGPSSSQQQPTVQISEQYNKIVHLFTQTTQYNKVADLTGTIYATKCKVY